MRLIFNLLLLYFCLASVGIAQELIIRSGDHPTFSRLTIPIPQNLPWEAKKTAAEISIEFPGFSGQFNLGEAFVRMKRERILSISNRNGVLVVETNCDCQATAFSIGQLLVLDVVDQGSALTGPEIQSPTEAEAPQLATPPTTPSTTLPWIGASSPFARSVTRQASGVQNPLPNLAAQDKIDILGETQKTLVEEVANAASMGLLEKSFQKPKPQTNSIEEAKAPNLVKPVDLPKTLESHTENIRITSSMDLPAGEFRPGLLATTSGLSCPAEDYINVDEWGTEESFSAQIGPARNQLMDARDNLDEEGAKELAKRYLFFGFGAEARRILGMKTEIARANPQLEALSEIFEHGSEIGENTLGSYTDCASDVSLWATLSYETLPKDALVDSDASLRALNKLPEHLRQIIAPALSDRLLRYGDSANAAMAMRSIERLPSTLSPEAIMAQADLSISSGQQADAELEAVIETNSTQSPEALAKLVEGKLKRDESLSYETATLVEAYVQELRGTEIGNQLRKTQIIALSQSQHFQEALSALSQIEPSLSPSAILDLKGTVLTQLTKKARDIDFLEHVFAQETSDLNRLPSTTRVLLARRLLALGFATQAQTLIADIAREPMNSERHILAARAALALGQPLQAQAELSLLNGPQADILRAQAKEMSGQYREAAALFDTVNASEEAAAAAWLSDEWRELTNAQTPRFGEISTLVQSDLSSENRELGQLGNAERALEESSAARDTLEKLLDDPTLQIAPES